jgi:hypothetical protein
MANEFVARNGIITNGKIGIGLTGPSESLETIGNIKSYQYISTATNSVSPLIISSTTKVNNLNADLLDGMHLTDIIINTPSPTVLDKAYSAKYSDDHYMPIAFSTRYYYNKVTTTTATLGDKPGVTASNYMTLTTTNQTIDWNSAVKLKVSRTSANDITFNQDSIFNHKLYCSFDRNCTITFGFRRFVGATQIASNDTKVMSFSTNVVTAVDIQMISNLLSGNTLYLAGTVFTDEIFISQDTPSSIVSKYYCGVNVGGTEYFSWHSLSTPAMVLNTEQIADGAITIPKLAEDTYNWIDNKVSKSGDTMSGDLNMTGNNFINAGFATFSVLPTTFQGTQITYANRVYTWNGTKYISNTDILTNFITITDFTTFNPTTLGLAVGDCCNFKSDGATGKPTWASTIATGIIICTYPAYYKFIAYGGSYKGFAIGYQSSGAWNGWDLYDASGLLTKIKTVDGAGSGLDADLLDGKHLSDMINGTINYISKFTSTASIGNSLIYDNGTNVGIGTASPSEKLDVNGNINSFEYKYSNGNNVGSRYNATNSTIEFYFN